MSGAASNTPSSPYYGKRTTEELIEIVRAALNYGEDFDGHGALTELQARVGLAEGNFRVAKERIRSKPESPEQIIHRLTTALEMIRDRRCADGSRLISGWEAVAIAHAALSEAGESEHEE